MRRKIFAVFIVLFSLYSAFFVTSAKAQTFSCIWDISAPNELGGVGKCVATQHEGGAGIGQCSGDFRIDQTKCDVAQTQLECTNLPEQSCVLIDEPQGQTGYQWSTSGCIPTFEDPPPFINEPACIAAHNIGENPNDCVLDFWQQDNTNLIFGSNCQSFVNIYRVGEAEPWFINKQLVKKDDYFQSTLFVLSNPGDYCAKLTIVDEDGIEKEPEEPVEACFTIEPPTEPEGGIAGDDTPEEGSSNCDSDKLDTALGCIEFDSVPVFVARIVPIGIGVAGAISLIIISISSYKIMTSHGDPKALQGAQAALVSAIMGLILISLSVFFLRFVGVNVLGIF